MRPGKKLTSIERKKLAGTFRATVDGATSSIITVAADTPVMPDWLPEAAQKVWAADLHRVTACGLTETDSQMFALYCVTMSDFIASVAAGQPANAAFRSELRKQNEMIGIAGAKSRLAKVGAATGEATASPFTIRR